MEMSAHQGDDVPAKFQLKKGTTGKYRFVVLSSNGQVVATSQAYERKASALAGIRSIEKIVASAAPVEDTTTKEWAEAEAAARAVKASKPAKKSVAKKSVAKNVVKKAITKASSSAPAAPRKAASTKAAGKRSPVRRTPPPVTKPPEQVVPRI